MEAFFRSLDSLKVFPSETKFVTVRLLDQSANDVHQCLKGERSAGKKFRWISLSSSQLLAFYCW